LQHLRLSLLYDQKYTFSQHKYFQYLTYLLALFSYLFAGMYAKQKKYEIAEFFYEDCLKKRTAILGALHPATLHTLCNLSAVNTQLVRTFAELLDSEGCCSRFAFRWLAAAEN
jgi:hypothetical protein